MQGVHALDADHIPTGAGNARAHGDQTVGQVYHFRLAGGVLDDRLAVGQTGGHHQVLGASHRHHVGEQARALQAGHLGVHVTVLHLDLGAHGLQALDVLVHRPRTDGTATGQAHPGLTEASHQRAEHQDGSTHGLDHFVGRDRVVHPARIQRDDVGIAADLHAHLLEQAQQRTDVVQTRHVGKGHRLLGQQRRTQDRQGCILGAGNGDLARQAGAAFNQQFIHASMGVQPSSFSNSAHWPGVKVVSWRAWISLPISLPRVA